MDNHGGAYPSLAINDNGAGDSFIDDHGAESFGQNALDFGLDWPDKIYPPVGLVQPDNFPPGARRDDSLEPPPGNIDIVRERSGFGQIPSGI